MPGAGELKMSVLPLLLGCAYAAGISLCLFEDNLEVPLTEHCGGESERLLKNTNLYILPKGGGLCRSPYSSGGLLKPERCCCL